MDAAESKLWAAYQQERSIANRNALAERYLAWLQVVAARAIAKYPESSLFDVDDFVSWGFEGLLQSIERFEPERNLLFTTYAMRRVQGAMLDRVREFDWVPRLERSRFQEGDPQPREIVAMDPQVSPHGEMSTPLATMSTTDSDDPKGDHWWRQICRGLSRQETLVVLMYWRLDMNMKAVGRDLGLSESRVSQMMSAILVRLREKGDSLLAPRPGVPVAMVRHAVPEFTRRHVAKRKSEPRIIADEPELVEFVRPDCPESHERERLCMNIELVDRELEMVKAEIQMLQTRLEYLRSLRDFVANADPMVPALMTVAEMERRLIETTLAREGGNRDRTAAALGIGVRTLSDKLREYGYPPRGNAPIPKSATQPASVA